MKKNLLLIILFSATIAFKSNAQMSFKIGPEVGVHLSKSNYEALEDEKSKAILGQKIGVLAELKFGDVLAIQPGLFYNSVGYKISSDDSGLFSGSSFKSTFNNLTVPVYINAEFGGKTKFFIGVGPEFNYMLNGHFSGQFLGVDIDNEKIDFKEDGYKRVYVSANINAGLKFNDRLLFRLNYNFGLTSLEEDDNSSDIDPLKVGYYGVSVGYLFGGK